MTDEQHPKDEPIRLVDPDDRSLTLVNNHVEGRDDNRNLALMEEEKDENRIDDTFQEETAAEYGAVGGGMSARPFSGADDGLGTEDSENGDVTAGRGVGTFAIVLSILSLFFLPLFLGVAGIIVGFVARRYGANATGNWAIGIGAISILMTVFFSPFF